MTIEQADHGARPRAGDALQAKRFAMCVIACAAFFALIGSNAAHAQGTRAAAPPVFSSIDANGVDLVSRTFNYTAQEVAIGQPNAGGMVFSRSFIGAGWRDNYAGTINSSGAVYTVSIGATSETFTLSSGTYASDQRRGSTLTLSSGTYTYTLSDGTVALFDTALANGGSVYDANVARITKLTTPAGVETVWHYKSVTAQSVAALRLQSVTNNLGYQIHFEYSLDNPTLSSQLTAWKTLAKATGINMGVDYCDPDANTCSSFTVTWPYATYAITSAGGGNNYDTVTDTLGRATRYTTSSAGIFAIRRPSSTTNNNIQINYDGPGRVYDLRNSVGTWTYSSSDSGLNRTTTVTDPLSHTRVVESVIANSEMLSDTNGVSQTTSYQYDPYHRPTRVTMPEGNYTDYQYDARGNVTQTTMVAKSGSGLSNIVTSSAYDSSCSNPVTCNQPNSTTDARGYRTDYTYDSTHGGILTVTAPAPSGSTPVGSGTRPQTRYAYTSYYAYYKNSGGSIVAAATPVYRLTSTSSCATTSSCSGGSDETLTTIAYGPQSAGTANNLLPVSASSGAGDASLTATIATTYDAIGNVETVDGPLSGSGDTTRNYYDAGRQLTGVVGPDSGSSVYRALRTTYNADGQITVVERGTVSSQSSNPWSSFSSLWRGESAYNFDGQLITQTLVGGGSTQSVVQYSYDNAGRLDCTAARMNSATFAALPSACTLTIVASGLGPDRISRNTYDNANRLTKITNGYGAPTQIDEWTRTYSNNGLVVTIADAAGNLTTHVYDGFDRLSRIRFPNTSGGGSSTTDYEEYSYDANGNVTQTRLRDAATISNTFDNLNRITLADASTSTPDVNFTYDLFSRLLTQYTSAQTLTFTYDQLSRNLTQQSSALGTVSYQYDLASRRTRMTWPDSLYVTYDLSLYNEITAIKENGSTALATYTYDSLGRQSLLTRGNSTTETPSYDSAFNLSSLAQDLTANDNTISLAHNPLGGLTSRTNSNNSYAWSPISPATTSYADNGLNQYTSVGGTSFTYDSRGNLTSDGTNSYTYDSYNRLLTAPGSTSLSYDPVGRLYEQSVSGTATRFLYDGDELIGEFDGSGNLLRRYIPGAAYDAPVTWYEGSNTSDRRYLVQDERGSVIAVDASSGVSIYSYDEYGAPNAWSAPATGPRFRYAGALMFASAQLYSMRARVYAPNIGRFLQTDPILFDGGMNLYAYTANDPLNAIDPSGLMCTGSILVGGCGGEGGGGGGGGMGYFQTRITTVTGPGESGERVKYEVHETSWVPGVSPGSAYTGLGQVPRPYFQGDDDDSPSMLQPIQEGGATPPESLPGGPWRWSPDPNNSRGGKYIGRGGSSTSWDSKYKHWDLDDGQGNRTRWDRWGNLLEDGHRPPHLGIRPFFRIPGPVIILPPGWERSMCSTSPSLCEGEA